jgi:hypothetical protein
MAARFSVIVRRLLPLLACAGLAWPLSACEGQPDAEKMGLLLYKQIGGIFGAGDVPRAQVAAIPYATLGVRIGSSSEAMFVLESKSGANLQWVGGTQFAVATRDGRIMRTTGFVHNLNALADETAEGGHNAPGVRDFRFDLSDINAYGVAVHCTERDVGPERIVIVGDAHETRHVIEDCAAPELDWNFSNEFWKDAASNYVWRSEQTVHPGLDPITLESLRPSN